MGSNFVDPRRPRNRMLDMVIGAASQRFPYPGPDENDLRMYGTPPSQDRAPTTVPPESTPPSTAELRERAKYEELLGQPPTEEKRPAWWKQALGYAARTVGGPLAGTDLPERLIIGDKNLKARRQRQAELGAAKELTESEEARRKAGIESGELDVKRRGATTDEDRQRFEREKLPVQSQVDIISAGGRPSSGKVALPSGQPGVESEYEFPSPDWDVPEPMRSSLGGAQSVPRGAAGQALSTFGQLSKPPERYGATGGVIYDKTTGLPTYVKPTEQRQRVFNVEGRLVDENGKVLYEPPPQTGIPSELVDDLRLIEGRVTDQLGSVMDRALNILSDPSSKDAAKIAAIQKFEIQKQDIQESYRREYRAIFNADPPVVPNPELPFVVQETPGTLWGTNESVEFTGGAAPVTGTGTSAAGSPPVGATSPANIQPPPSGPTVPPETAPLNIPPSPIQSSPAASGKPPVGHEIEKDGVRYRWDGNVYVEVL